MNENEETYDLSADKLAECAGRVWVLERRVEALESTTRGFAFWVVLLLVMEVGTLVAALMH